MTVQNKIAFVFCIAVCSLVYAAPPESTIRQALDNVLNGEKIEQVVETSQPGLFEVVTPRGIVYTNKTGSFVIFGTMIDSATRTNLTEKHLDELTPFEFSKLPFSDAIKTVRGNGSRVIATIEDPNCGYCKKLYHNLSDIDNVTIYTFMIPILAADSAAKIKSVWCADDRAKAWGAVMTAGVTQAPARECATPADRNLELAHKLHITGTPAILFANNEKSRGTLTTEQLESKFPR